MKGETYYFASNVGDTTFLQFIRDRLVEVHGENPNLDYIHTLDGMIEKMSPLLNSYEKYRREVSTQIDRIHSKLPA